MRRTTGFVLAGLLVALLLAGVVSTFASGSPDGLDSAATRGCTVDAAGKITGGTCIAQGEKAHEVGGPFAGYAFAGSGDPFVATAVPGVAGVLVTFGIAAGLFRVTRRRASAG